jgi:hypothetical protein
VMSWEALSLSVFKNPAVMRLAVKTKSIVVYVRSALCKELAYHSLFWASSFNTTEAGMCLARS